MVSSSTDMKQPPLSRTASRICFQRTGAAMEMPSAIVSLGHDLGDGFEILLPHPHHRRAPRRLGREDFRESVDVARPEEFLKPQVRADQG